MTEVNLQQYGLANGMLKMVAANKKGSKSRVQRISELSQLEQVMLRYNYVMAMTKNAHGDFERTGGGAANQTRMFQENLKELGVTFGTYLLPYFTKTVIQLNELLVKFGQLSPKTQKTILIIAGLSAVLGPLAIVLGSLITALTTIYGALTVLAPLIPAIAAAAAGAAAPFIAWAGAIMGVVAALGALGIALNHAKEMSRIKNMDSIKTDNLTNENLQKLSYEYQMTGNKKNFEEKYGKNITRAVKNYNKTTNNNSATTNNYFSGNISLSGNDSLNAILAGGQNVPLYAN